MEPQALARIALKFVNAIIRELGEAPLESFPRGSLKDATAQCPIAKALTALIFLEERRVVFCFPWYAAAATKVWSVSFADPFLMSVVMPDAIYEFSSAFRRGLLPDLLE
ncbi:MAG: hypothetical protein ACREQI_08075 [Candidatus Binataceae bacterium]